MKVKLLQEVGIHEVGTILDVEGSIVIQLENSGLAERYVEGEVKKVVAHAIITDENKEYKDSNGKTYNADELALIDKRTALYKDIIQNSK